MKKLCNTKVAREFRFATKWINENLVLTDNINMNKSSYDYVNEIKNSTGQTISNEAFQMAVRTIQGRRVATIENSLNEYYNIVNNNQSTI